MYMIKVERFDEKTGFEIIDSVVVERLGAERNDVIDVAVSHYQKKGDGARTHQAGLVLKGVRSQEDAMSIMRRFLNERNDEQTRRLAQERAAS
jgi:hypothetical protein